MNELIIFSIMIIIIIMVVAIMFYKNLKKIVKICARRRFYARGLFSYSTCDIRGVSGEVIDDVERELR